MVAEGSGQGQGQSWYRAASGVGDREDLKKRSGPGIRANAVPKVKLRTCGEGDAEEVRLRDSCR